MPNHIFTTATIFGPTDVLTTIYNLADTDNNDAANPSVLEHYLPLPAEATETTTRTNADGTTTTTSVFTPGGYEQALDLWGSKWGDYELDTIDDSRDAADPSITIRFQSAWAPVVEGYRKLSALLGIDAVLGYEDECGNYLGATAIADGAVVGESYVDSSEVEAHPRFADVPAYPEDTDAADYEDKWQAWQEAHSDAWSELLVECEDYAFAVLDDYRQARTAAR